MPAGLTAIGDRKLVLMAGGAAVLLIILSILLTPGSDTSETPTTYSTGSGGARAAYLLLQEAGYPVRRWERSVLELPPGTATTLIIAQPAGEPTAGERAAVGRFMEQGGRVIAIGVSGAFFLPQDYSVPEPAAEIAWRRLTSRSPSRVARAAPEITMATDAYWHDTALPLVLYGDDHRSRVITYAVGAGEAIWWASATPATNAGLAEPGNLEFFLASIGNRSRPILWDEYFHGHRPLESRPPIRTGLGWIGLQVALIVAAVLLTYSRRSGPTLAAAPESRQSPLEFVRTLGSLYRRARAASIAVDITYQRFRYQLTRRLGMAGAVSTADLDRAVRARWRIDLTAFSELMRACDAARLDSQLASPTALKLTQGLFDWSITLGLD